MAKSCNELLGLGKYSAGWAKSSDGNRYKRDSDGRIVARISKDQTKASK